MIQSLVSPGSLWRDAEFATLLSVTNPNGTYRKPRMAKEADEQKNPRPVSNIGGGRGGSLIAFSQGIGVANGR